MAAKIIHIDTYIGRWGYSKELLRFDLEGTRKEGAVLRISSLGGDVFHALDMYNQIAAHGNVEVLFAGPSASAATFLAMAAKRVSIVDNCFLLVHKVMAGVDNFGLFNEDELEALIADLRTLKSENREFDKVIAHIYAKRTGRTHEEMIRQMKQGTWMSAAQALEYGFVDQVVAPDEKMNFRTLRFVAMVTGDGLPPFPADASPVPETGEPISIDNNKTDHMKQFTRINQLLDVSELLSNEEGVYLNQEQLEALEQELQAGMQSLHNYEEAVRERDLAREEATQQEENLAALTLLSQTTAAERDQALVDLAIAREEALSAQTSLAQLRSALDAIDPTVAQAMTGDEKAAAIRLLLSRMPGAPAAGIMDARDPDPKPEGVDWELINSLPHNREFDRNL